MNNSTKKLFLGAMMSGILAGTGALAADTPATKTTGKNHEEKAKKDCACKKNEKHCKCKEGKMEKSGCGKESCEKKAEETQKEGHDE